MSENKGKLTVTITDDGREVWKQDGISGIILSGIMADEKGVAGIYGELSILDMTTAFVALSQSNEKMKVAAKLAQKFVEYTKDNDLKEIILQAIMDADDDKDAVPQEGSVEGAE